MEDAAFQRARDVFLIDVENQAKAQANFGRRIYSYFAQLHERHNLPVYPVALFTFPTPKTKQEGSYRVAFPDRVVLDFQYRVIQLNQLKWREFARKDNPVASALMAKMEIAPGERPRVRLACVRMLGKLRLEKRKMQVVLGFIDSYLRLTPEEEKANQAEYERLGPTEKEKMMEVTILWKEEGRQKACKKACNKACNKAW